MRAQYGARLSGGHACVMAEHDNICGGVLHRTEPMHPFKCISVEDQSNRDMRPLATGPSCHKPLAHA